MKKITLSILLAGICLQTNLIAQDRPSESLSLINGVSTNNDLYNGTLTVEIPLYKISVGNIEIASQISNTPIGFDPKSDESIFGMGWYGNLFGQITREVNKDFLLKSFFVNDPDVVGIIVSQERKNRETQDCIIQSQKFTSHPPSKTQILLSPLALNLNSSFKPDKFYFDFFGYKGYFVFDNQGVPIVFCENAKLKVLGASSLASDCYSVTSPIPFDNTNINQIRIIDDKGNTFYFGGTFDALDVNYSQYRNTGTWYSSFGARGYSVYSRAGYIMSWYLKEVRLVTGETIVANYKSGNSNVLFPFLQKTLVSSGESFPTSFPSQMELNQANIDVTQSRRLLYGGAEAIVDVQNYTKRAILQSVEVPGKGIKINYNYIKDSNNLIHLNNINVNYFGKSENIVINQLPLGGTNYRYFMESLLKNDQKFSFEYYKTDNLPSKYWNGVNTYGFWNGTQYSGVGNANDYIDVGLLKKVTYPTKGYSIFNYEKGDVSKSVKNPLLASQSILSDYPEIPKIAKARVSSKIESNGQQEYRTDYTYKLDNGKSAGILNGVVYSQVQEKIQGKGMVEYFFTNFNTNPDINNLRRYNGDDFMDQTDAAAYSNNREFERGKILKKNIYDSNNKLIREHQYEYQSFLKPENELVDLSVNNCSNCKVTDDSYYVDIQIVDVYSRNKRITTRYIPVVPYLLKKQKVIDYLNDKQVSVETSTRYRESNVFWHPYPEEVQSTTSIGTSIKKYIYPYELKGRCPGFRTCSDDNSVVGGQFANYSTMVSFNIWTPVIEIIKNENNKYSLKENIFHELPIVPKKIRISKLDADLDFTNYKINVDKTVDQINYDLIDDKTNYIQTTDKSGVPTVTIYGYKQRFPLLKIKGLTYVQFMQILGQPTASTDYLNLSIVTKSNSDIDTASEQSLIDELNTIRNNSSLKNYPITTYTYDPLVGVTSITPPSGIREVYLYDSANRLEKVVDVDGKVLKEMKYNYKN